MTLFASLDDKALLDWVSLIKDIICCKMSKLFSLTLLHSERPKLYAILAFLSAIRLRIVITEMETKINGIVASPQDVSTFKLTDSLQKMARP